MNMHPGHGPPPPGAHYGPPGHHPHPYGADVAQGYPPGVPHLRTPPRQLDHDGEQVGDENMDDGMHDPDDPEGHQRRFELEQLVGMSSADVQRAKRKRRRQALSCTECKRRKIRCDRQNPCAPCVRRGESDKCKWHVIEPAEKFVTRTEYDDLRRRFDALEFTVAQLTGRPPASIYQGHGLGGPWGVPPMGQPDNDSQSARSPSVVVDPTLQSPETSAPANAGSKK